MRKKNPGENDSSDDDESSNENEVKVDPGNTKKIYPSKVSPPTRPSDTVPAQSYEKRKDREEPVSARTRSKKETFESHIAELQDLEYKFMGEKKRLMTIEDVAHGLMALVGGTDTSKDIPETFQEAWNHPDPEERKIWR